jgi:hypothetical protein
MKTIVGLLGAASEHAGANDGGGGDVGDSEEGDQSSREEPVMRTDRAQGDVSFASTVRLLDPSGEEERLYLLATTASSFHAKSEDLNVLLTMIYEIVQVDAGEDGSKEYTSMFVNNEVVNHPLFTFTPVDPLFWILSMFPPPPPSSKSEEGTSAQPLRWQPMDQILSTLNLGLPDSVIRSLLVTVNSSGETPTGSGWCQLDHLFLRMEGGDEETYHKFCPQKALKWLRRKQEAVQQVLTQVEEEKNSRRRQSQLSEVDDSASNGNSVFVRIGDKESGGAIAAFDASFCFSKTENGGRDDNEDTQELAAVVAASNVIVKDSNPSAHDETAARVNDGSTKQILDESVQIVCNYLNNPWRDALLRSLTLTRASLEGMSKKSPSSSNRNDKISNATTAPLLAPPLLSIEQQLLGGGGGDVPVTGHGKVDRRQQHPPSSQLPNKKSKLKPSDALGMKKLTSFFAKK